MFSKKKNSFTAYLAVELNTGCHLQTISRYVFNSSPFDWLIFEIQDIDQGFLFLNVFLNCPFKRK